MPSSPLSVLSLSLLFTLLLLVCVAVKKDGDAPAVFHSATCLRFNRSSLGCHVAVDRVRRRSQESCAVCDFLSFGRHTGKMGILEKDFYGLQAATRLHSSFVEARNEGLCCCYSSESLDEESDYIFVFFADPFLSFEPDFVNSSAVELYKNKDFCRNPEALTESSGLLDFVPRANTKSNSSSDIHYDILDFRYKLKREFGRGSYGEVWLAFPWNCLQDVEINSSPHNLHSSSNKIPDGTSCPNDTDGELFILKRIRVEIGNAAYISGIREKHFGELFLNASRSLDCFLMCSRLCNLAVDYSKKVNEVEQGLKHVARFVESLISKSNEIWLVFQNEGVSLSHMVTRDITGHDEKEENASSVKAVQPSKWWYWLRTTGEGQKQMKDLLYQLLLAVKACHDGNITHRDIKPENMIICFEDLETGKCSSDVPVEGKKKLHMLLIDFGSAIDDFTMKHLYGNGPTRSEQTFEYEPPEALLNRTWYHAPNEVRMRYDMWSVGVVVLELIMGSPQVFRLSDRTIALLNQQLEGLDESIFTLAYRLRSLMELCILIPGVSSHHHQDDVSPATWKCSEEVFSQHVKMTDPLKLGFPNVWALRLARQLLVWDPEGRLTVDEALDHPYFRS